jgi:ABC-type phosphate transport system auxiliary subunit
MALALLLASLLLAPWLSGQSPSSSASSDGKLKISLTDLEALQKDLLESKQGLQEARALNEQLRTTNDSQLVLIKQLSGKLQAESQARLDESTAKQKALTELQQQLTTVSASLSASNARTVFDTVLWCSAAAGAGLLLGVLGTL